MQTKASGGPKQAHNFSCFFGNIVMNHIKYPIYEIYDKNHIIGLPVFGSRIPFFTSLAFFGSLGFPPLLFGVLFFLCRFLFGLSGSQSSFFSALVLEVPVVVLDKIGAIVG